MYEEEHGNNQNNQSTPYASNWQEGGQFTQGNSYQNQQGGNAQQGAGSWQSNGQPQQNTAGQQGGTWQNGSQQSQYYNTWQDGGQNSWQNAGQGNAWQTADQYQKEQGKSKKRVPKEKKKKTSSGLGVGKVIAIALCCSLLGGVIGAGGMLLGERYLGFGKNGIAGENGTVILEGQRPVSPLNVADIDTSRELTEAELYAMNVNSTVGITTSITINYWGYQTTTPASGSGFILTEDGYIVTNQHVIDNSNTITVTTYDGTVYDAELIGYDTSNDIAVLKVDAKGLTPVVLGDSDTANVGDKVVAIGNPLGELTFSLVGGFISALDRSVTFSTGATMDLMQVSCAINAGNSGGPLFNMYGEVIGITNAKYSNNGDSSEASIENIGFAIPISNVRSIIESIITKGYITTPYIGVSITDVSSDLQSFGLPVGALIKEVVEGGPADKSGLQENDIITEINGTEITSGSDLKAFVGKTSAGDELTVKVYRQGQTLEISIVVGETRKEALEEEQSGQQQEQQGNEFPFPWGFGGFGF